MSNELIPRGQVLTELDRVSRSALLREDYAAHSALEKFKGNIQRIRAAAAQPIKCAKWEICSDGFYPYCSICYCEPQGRQMTKYCPNCGAKMDGGTSA